MLLCAITQRTLLPGDESARRTSLINHAREWARAGVQFLQIREKDLTLPELQNLATAIVSAVREDNSPMRILLNGPPETALNAGCHGVHLHADASPAAILAAQTAFSRAGRELTLSAACHHLADIERLRSSAQLLLFSPVFEKVTPDRTLRGVGLAALAQAAQTARNAQVLALGGVTAQNARACIESGAAGVAAIRLFLNNGWKSLLSAP